MEPLTDSVPLGNNSSGGYVKFVRSQESLELLRDPKAFALLAFIAFRARWRSGLGVDGVQLGEAMIGDFRYAGMTRGEYREATKRLHKYHLATFRTTNRGTFAKLANAKVFDLNAPRGEGPGSQPDDQRTASQQPTDNQPTTNEQPLTKKGIRKEGEESKKETPPPSSDGREAEVDAIYKAYPKHEDGAEGKKAIRKALKLRKAEFLLERTRLYAQSRVNHPKHPDFTPLCATWFNKRRFDDDPASWTRTNGARNGQFAEDFSSLRPLNLEPVRPGYIRDNSGKVFKDLSSPVWRQ